MKKAFLTKYVIFLSLAAAGFLIGISQAAAQEAQAGAEAEEVVVVGAPIQRSRAKGWGTYGSSTEVIELSRRVSYADLDLTKYEDVMEMEKRIETTARESCEKLSDMFRLELPKANEVRTCTKTAVANARERLQVAIAGANSE
jgi:UrcA family protein